MIFCMCVFVHSFPSVKYIACSLQSKEGRLLFIAQMASSSEVPLPVATSRHRWLTLGVLVASNMCLGVTLSCIVPFFPGQARAKGLSTADIGFIIGTYQLTTAISAPLLGRSMASFGPGRLFSAGLCLCATAVVLFGWLPKLPSASSFFLSALSLRALMALGFVGFKCSQMAILAAQFQSNLATLVGLVDTFSALSYSVGPILGSALTQLGGYSLPFAAFGMLMLLAGIGSVCLLSTGPTQTEPIPMQNNEEAGLRAVLAIPEVWLTALGQSTLMICCFFYDASLADHITRVDPSPMLAGTLISATAFTSMLSSPIWGYLVDRWPNALAEPIMLMGALGGAFFALMIGPSPLVGFLQLSLPALFVGFIIQGMALTAMATPSLKHCLRMAKQHGLDSNSATTCGCISGVLQGSISLGAFLGNSLGGLSVQKIGFEWTATLAAALQLPFILGLICYKACVAIQKQYYLPKEAEPLAESRQSADDAETIVEFQRVSAI